MTTDYISRLRLSIDGDEVTKLSTRSGAHVATGYTRIVIGDRGPYVEFEDRHLNTSEFCHCSEAHYYYIELRTLIDDVKTYAQLRRVDYADYVPGRYYISPFELYVDGLALIDTLK